MNFSVSRCLYIVSLFVLLYVKQAINSVSDTSPNVFPFHAVVDSKFLCAGILISDEYILLPAHCVNGTTWGAKIYLGYSMDAYYQPHFWQSETEVTHTYDIVVHEKFLKISKNVYLNDIALVKLNNKIALRKNIHPAILMSADEYRELLSEPLVNVTGWYTNTVANLSVTEVSLLNQDLCHYLYGTSFYQNQELCLKLQNNDGHRLNLSGNPVSINGKILGYITRSPCLPRDAVCEDHDVIFALPPFLDWISRKTNKSIEQLTGPKQTTNKKLDYISKLIEEVKVQNLENRERIGKLENNMEQILEALKEIKSSIANSCIVWNEP